MICIWTVQSVQNILNLISTQWQQSCNVGVKDLAVFMFICDSGFAGSDRMAKAENGRDLMSRVAINVNGKATSADVEAVSYTHLTLPTTPYV